MLENLESIIQACVEESPFNKLRNVTVSNCNRLEALFFNCSLDDVLSLEHIDISLCKQVEVMMTVMVNEEATNHIEFTHLKSLFLSCLPRLQKFCSKIDKFGQFSRDNNLENPIRNNIGDSFFSEEVSLPSLEKLRINGANNLKWIWTNILIPNSFSKLKEIEIYSCNNLEKVFSSNMISILTCLNILRITYCKLVKGIFELQEPSVTEVNFVVLQTLRRLELCNLPNLEYVWNNDPCELQSFVNMESLSIKECSRLERKYPVKILKQFERLEIDIRQLSEVLGKEKPADMLESNQTMETSKVEVTHLQDGFGLFPNIKKLKLCCSGYSLIHLPMEIIQMLYQLEEFELADGAFIEEIFPIEILIPTKNQHARSMVLESLVLSKLPNLKHLLTECSQKNTSLFQGLIYLKISQCGILSALVSSSMSFTNLGILQVDRCHSLTYLLNPSVARTLVQLQHLRLEECKGMITVIEGGDEEGNGEIVFNKLRSLVIYSFSKLRCFYSGRCSSKFPRLSYLSIYNCPKVKVFSLGMVSTPRLESKHFRPYNFSDTCYLPKDPEEIVVGDINVFIRQAWKDNIDTSIRNMFAEQIDLEEFRYVHSYSHFVEAYNDCSDSFGLNHDLRNDKGQTLETLVL